MELGYHYAQTKCKRGPVQQKLPSKLSYQGKCYSFIAHFFIYSSSNSPFNAFRDEKFLQMMNSVSVENDFKPLTITHLKTHLNAKNNAFKKASHQEVLDYQEEYNENQFCQCAHYGNTSLNKDKHQAFGMQFTDTKFCHNNIIVFSFRNTLSHKAEKVA